MRVAACVCDAIETYPSRVGTERFPSSVLGRREWCTREGRYLTWLTRPRAVPTRATSTMTAVAAHVLGVSSSAPARKLLQIPLIPGDVVDTPQDQLPTADTSEGVESLASAFDSGDTAWMLTSTALVLLMAIPGLRRARASQERAQRRVQRLRHRRYRHPRASLPRQKRPPHPFVSFLPRIRARCAFR